MSRTYTTPDPIPDMAAGIQRAARAERLEAMRPKTAPAPADPPPTADPIDNLHLLSLVNPEAYRGCGVFIAYWLEMAWARLPHDVRIERMQQFDARWPKTARQPGERL